MFGLLALIVALISFLLIGFGRIAYEGEVVSSEAEAPLAAQTAETASTTLTLVERSDNVNDIDLGEEGPSLGDMIVWGPDPLYDETNTTDTGATTQGVCVVFNVTGDCLLNETIVFPDGSTIEIQGIEAGETVVSTRTIVGGSGRYLDVRGTVTVEPASDLSSWTKTFEFES